jgi:sigma-B regulation protein RsbU (phosphoserine phosphatase)
MFVFFSDGIPDATNKAGEMFSRKRIEEIITKCAGISADCAVKSLFNAVSDHASGVETFDDQTIVAIRVKESPAKDASGKRK